MKSIKGIILPADWDTDGRVTAIQIAAFDEAQYVLEGPLVSDLMTKQRRPVEIQGDLNPGDPKPRLFAHSYRELPPRKINGLSAGHP